MCSSDLNGRVLQWPVQELEGFRTNERSKENELTAEGTRAFDLMVEGIAERGDVLRARIAEELLLTWGGGIFELRFCDESMDSVGAGRKVRYERLDELRNVRIVGDVSSIEIFVNDGELTFSTRYYPREYGVHVESPGSKITLWDIDVAHS